MPAPINSFSAFSSQESNNFVAIRKLWTVQGTE